MVSESNSTRKMNRYERKNYKRRTRFDRDFYPEKSEPRERRKVNKVVNKNDTFPECKELVNFIRDFKGTPVEVVECIFSLNDTDILKNQLLSVCMWYNIADNISQLAGLIVMLGEEYSHEDTGTLSA